MPGCQHIALDGVLAAAKQAANKSVGPATEGAAAYLCHEVECAGTHTTTKARKAAAGRIIQSSRDPVWDKVRAWRPALGYTSAPDGTWAFGGNRTEQELQNA